MNYLMSCQSFLKERDVNGWIENFAPDLMIKTEEPPRKKRRGCPNVVLWKDHDPCIRCNSTEIIDDVKEGSVVCTACGTIQFLQSLTMDPAHMTVDQLKNGNRLVVHRYSRVVYFRSFLCGIQGETKPQLKNGELDALRLILAGERNVTPECVLKALKALKICTRLRRHLQSLTVTLSNNAHQPVKIPPPTMREMMKLFRRVEWFWEQGMMKMHCPERKVFLSYPYIFYQLCVHLKVRHLTDKKHLLQSRALQAKLHKVYGRIAKKANLDCDLTVFR